MSWAIHAFIAVLLPTPWQPSPAKLVVAMGFTDEIGLNESPDIQPLLSRAGVQLLDTRTFSRPVSLI